MKKNNQQSGQVLLILVMILATVFAVVFSVSFTNTTDTKLAKLEEDSKRALAASQSILEASLQKNAGTYYLNTDLGGLNLAGFTGVATVSATTGPEFVTPLLQKDEQYMLYLSDYDVSANTFSNPYSLSFDLYFNSGSSTIDCDSGASSVAAVELTFVDVSNAVTKSYIDPCNRAGTDIGTMSGGTVENTSFARKTSTFTKSNMKAVFMRVLYASTKIGIKEINSQNLPTQGKTTTAQATSQTSVTSKIELFQSYPQIPAEFFSTSL